MSLKWKWLLTMKVVSRNIFEKIFFFQSILWDPLTLPSPSPCTFLKCWARDIIDFPKCFMHSVFTSRNRCYKNEQEKSFLWGYSFLVISSQDTEEWRVIFLITYILHRKHMMSSVSLLSFINKYAIIMSAFYTYMHTI